MYSSPLSSNDLLGLQRKVEKLVIDQGEFAFNNWRNPEFHAKGDEGDLVTTTDIAIEEILTRELKAIFPQAEIYGEENGGEIGSEYTWLIDPIDGTKHFAHKMPSFFVQVSLLSNRDPIIGIIYDPVSRQLFSASLGNGSFLNGEKLINKSTVHLSNAVIDVDLGGKEDIDWKLEALKNLVKESYRVR
jgi:fructose-1,6-bisphosphatase/inositol monophosphatase family enzyme